MLQLRFLWLLPLVLFGPALTSASPCGTDWTYDSAVGWCMRQIRVLLSWDDARSYCASLRGPGNGSRADGAKLGAPSNKSTGSAANRLMTRLGNFGDMWVAARQDPISGAYTWVDQDPAARVTTGWGSSPGSEACLFMKSVATADDGTDWKTGVELDSAKCTELRMFFCYYEAKHCSLSDLVGYSAESMDLQPQVANIGEATVANCRTGYYRKSQLTAALAGAAAASAGADSGGSAGTPAPNSVNCTDSASSSDPELVTPVWVQGVIEECIKVGCSTSSLTDLGIENSLPFADALMKSTYKFGEGFNVTCVRGYVSSTETSSKVARVSCLQDPSVSWLGMWMPSSSDVCTPIQCADVSSVLANYSGVRPNKAYNKELNRWYSELEVNQFSGYSTEVYITCNEVGLFFQDQKYERQLACQVQNDSSTTASWVGIRGTFSIGNVIQNIRCIEVVCNIVDLFHLIEEGGSVLDLLNGYHINEGIGIFEARTGTFSNVTKQQFGSIGSLLFGSSVSVSCPVDWLFVQSGTDQTNIVLNLAQMTLMCSKTGKWNQTLGMCIERTAAIQLLGRQKQYVPPAKEANAAVQMGVVTIAIVIVFFVCIVILDLATIKRDFNLLKTNVFYLRMRLKQM